MRALAKEKFGDDDPDDETLADALALDKRYWEKMELAVQNAIANAFGGE